MIKKQLIVKETGQYDMECVRKLVLINRNIMNLSGLESCINIVQLCLSHNKITNITSIESLVNLQRLDLSFNNISKIENMSTFKQLKWLDLRNNCQLDIPSIAGLSEINNSLQSLLLQDTNGENSNKVCQLKEYKSSILSLVPQLIFLDGQSLFLEDKIKTVLKNVTPSTDALDYQLSVESWYTSQLLRDSLTQSYDNVPVKNIEIEQELRTNVAVTSDSLLQQADDVMIKYKD